MAARPTNKESSHADLSSKKLTQLVVLITLLLSGVLFYWIGLAAESATPEDVSLRTVKIKRNDEDDRMCYNICTSRQQQRQKRYGGNLGVTKEMYDLALAGKAKMIAKIKEDYGSYFSKIFESTSEDSKLSYRPVEPVAGDRSLDGLKRKLKLKILQVQTEIQKRDKLVNGCSCVNGAKAVGEVTNSTSAEEDPFFAKYVWATGGHSAAAAHGNLFNESYTAFLERTASHVFNAIGINFEGRNYAMGGTSSGFEISMCMKEVFGNDYDFLSWEYGMTDGRDGAIRLLHYFYRGAVLAKSRPAILGNGVEGPRLTRIQSIQELGVPAFYVNGDKRNAMIEAFPDSQGLSEEELNKIPFLLRNAVCGGQFEKGEPYCSVEKYNNAVCSARKGKASWHPGTKSHALYGVSWSLFLTEVLIEALKDLSEIESYDPHDLLTMLQAEEDSVYAEAIKAPLPEANDLFRFKGKGYNFTQEDRETVFRGPNICHTARLPSKIRYNGILTETDKLGDLSPPGKETYDIGIERISEADISQANGKMRLVYEKGERERCEVILKPDYKDFFYGSEKDGWVSLQIPNDAEKREYGYDVSNVKGLIVLFLGNCDWGKCAKGDLRAADFVNKTLEFEVNGKAVIDIPTFEHGGGILLQGEHGYKWQPNENGVFEIRARANNPDSYFRISSIAIY